MSELYTFMAGNPWTTFFLCCFIFGLFKSIFYLLPKMIIRQHNIKKHGWPPEHLDADGEFKDES